MSFLDYTGLKKLVELIKENFLGIEDNAVSATTATKLGSDTVGGTAKPIYLSSGSPTALSSTVGSSTKPVYLSSGTITASSSTVGGKAQPVYLNSGTVTALSSTVGYNNKPVYLDDGVITALSTTVGSSTKHVFLNGGTITASSSTVGSGTNPVYMSTGTIKASSSTVGSSSSPVWLNSGTITECSDFSAGGVDVSSSSIDEDNSQNYVKFDNGLIIQWGSVGGSSKTITFGTEFSSTNYAITVTGYGYEDEYYGIDATYITGKTTTSCGIVCKFETDGMSWIAIGC